MQEKKYHPRWFKLFNNIGRKIKQLDAHWPINANNTTIDTEQQNLYLYI